MSTSRHFINESDRRCIIALREQGESTPSIARRLGLSHASVHRVVRQLVIEGRLEQPARVVGSDGKSYRAERPEARR